MHRVFLAIKGNPSLALSRVLSPLSIFEDQVLKVKQAQRNLFDRETLLAKGNSNRQEAKELSQLIDHLRAPSVLTQNCLNWKLDVQNLRRS